MGEAEGDGGSFVGRFKTQRDMHMLPWWDALQFLAVGLSSVRSLLSVAYPPLPRACRAQTRARITSSSRTASRTQRTTCKTPPTRKSNVLLQVRLVSPRIHNTQDAQCAPGHTTGHSEARTRCDRSTKVVICPIIQWQGIFC